MIAFTGEPLSDNIIERPDGSIVACDAVLCRTGFQEYLIGELPQDRAIDLGIDVSDQRAKIKLYRSPEEVFNPTYVHSVEASPVTDNHPPNADFVDPKNFRKYSHGHVENVRRSKDLLSDGNEALIGDIVIAAEPLLSDVKKKKKREISLGYDYKIDRDGDVILQVGMVNNHLAIVPKGRAGSEARINDAAVAEAESEVKEVESTPEAERKEEPVIPAAEPSPVTPTPTNAAPRQENKPMSWTLKSLFGKGLMAAAKEDNADPEALADAAQQFSRITRATGSGRANDAEMEGEKCDDRRADDRHRSDDRRADDRRSKDRHADDRRSDDRKADDRKADDRRADDRHADDVRGRMHTMLDRMMDARDRRSKDRRGGDADMQELRGLLDDYLMEEGEEPQHESEADDDELPEEFAEREGGEEEEEEPAEDELGEVLGEAEIVQPAADRKTDDRRADDVEGFEDGSGFHPIRGSEGYKRGKAGDPRKKRARDEQRVARAADTAHGYLQALRALKPFVARSKDSALRKAYTAQLRRAKGTSFGNDGSYADFASASRSHARARDEQEQDAGDDLKTVREFYAKAHNKKMEVK